MISLSNHMDKLFHLINCTIKSLQFIKRKVCFILNLTKTPIMSEKEKPIFESPIQSQQLPSCSGNCNNTLNTTCTVRLTAGTNNPQSVVFPSPLAVGDTLPVITDPFYLHSFATECESAATVHSPCGDIVCSVPIFKVSVVGSLPFYFQFPAEFWPCTGPTTPFMAYCNDVVPVNNIVCYNCDGALPALCHNGLSNVNGIATLISITQDASYIYFNFDIKITLPGC